MSEPGKDLEIGLAEFRRLLETYSAKIKGGGQLAIEDCFEIARLWNTVLCHTTLQLNEPGHSFYELVRDIALPKIVQTLEMTVSRGFSFYSQKHDFAIGGTLERRFRYRIVDADL
jgi:hypothetical protein